MAKNLSQQRTVLEAQMTKLIEEEERAAARAYYVAARAWLTAAKADPAIAVTALSILTRYVKKSEDRKTLKPFLDEIQAVVEKHSAKTPPAPTPAAIPLVELGPVYSEN